MGQVGGQGACLWFVPAQAPSSLPLASASVSHSQFNGLSGAGL